MSIRKLVALPGFAQLFKVRLTFLWIGTIAGGTVFLPAHAKVQWEVFSREVTVGPWAESAAARFPFANTGNTPVTILSVKSGCDCTTIDLERMTYAPGARGELSVTFNPQGRTGVQHKTIQVFIDDAPTQPTLLNLQVEITEAVTISPRLLWWKRGSPLIPKEVIITLARDAGAPVIALKAENPAINAKLVSGADGHHRLVIQPTSTEIPLRTFVQLQVTAPGSPQPRLYAIYVQVR